MGFSWTIMLTQVKLDKDKSLDKILRVYKQQDTPMHYNWSKKEISCSVGVGENW